MEIHAEDNDNPINTQRLSKKSAKRPIGICANNPHKRNTVNKMEISSLINPIASP